MHVKDLAVVNCSTEEDVLNCLFRGAELRTTSKHLLNSNSNRSHCIFCVYLEQRSRLGSSEKVVVKASPKAQSISLSKSVSVKSVVITPIDIYAGKSQPNTCISELRFE